MKKRRGYKFTNRKHPETGIMSVVLAVISLVSLLIVVVKTYLSHGVAPIGYGYTGILALVFAVVGEILAILALNEKRNYRLFPVLGIALNIAVFVFLGIIMYAGSHF